MVFLVFCSHIWFHRVEPMSPVISVKLPVISAPLELRSRKLLQDAHEGLGAKTSVVGDDLRATGKHGRA